MGNKDELYRRLEQARRMAQEAFDPLTRQRLAELTEELEKQIAAAEARDADAPHD